jgi:transcriptional regulator
MAVPQARVEYFIMYTPRSFAESDLPTLFDYVDAHPLGILVSATPDLAATHLPLILDRSAGPFGTLFGHLARANPQGRVASSMPIDALVIFAGPDAYITPQWYATKRETGRVVPTWNYVAVHAHGTLRLHDDSEFLRDHLERLTHRHEGGRMSPWHVSDAPTDYIVQQMKAIVGISVVIERLEGKWKMSQNRADADITGVIDGLNASGRAGEQEVASLVAARRPHSG